MNDALVQRVDCSVANESGIILLDFHSPGFKDLAHEFAKESGTHMNWDHFKSTMLSMRDMGSLISTCYNLEGSMIAIMSALIAPDLYTGEKTASELFWFVSWEYRASSVGVRMFQDMERRCKDAGVSVYTVAHFNHLNGGKVKSFYERNGFNHTENFYKKSLK